MASSSPIRLPPDYHTHNLLCKHAQGKPEEYAEAARRLGMTEVASTDHCPTDDGFGVDHRMRLGEFDVYRRWVDEARQRNGTQVLFGIEADYYPGCERFLARWLDMHPFDLVLGSVHFLDYWSTDPTFRGLGRHPDPEFVWRTYFAHVGRMADARLYDVVAHLDLPKRFGNAIDPASLRELALPALDRIAAADMCIEINTSGLLHAPRECYPSRELLSWACERGIGLTFGSDAHSPGRVGADFDLAVEMAKSAGYTQSARFAARRRTFAPLP